MAQTRERDSQRSKVWAVLREMSRGETFDHGLDVRKYMANTLDLRVIERRFGHNLSTRFRERVNVLGGRPTTYPGRYTKLASYCFDEKTALYHLAYHVHHWTQQGAGKFYPGEEIPYRHEGMRDPDAAWHGWQFCHIWYLLVRYRMGKEAGDELLALFKKHKVRHRPKRKREPTPKQLEALRKSRMEKNAHLIEKRWEKAKRKKRGIEL